jgi:hypothetical protein
MHIACPYGVCLWRVLMTCAYGVCLWCVLMTCAYGVCLWCVLMACAYGVSLWFVIHWNGNNGRVKGIFGFSKTSKQAVGPTQWVPEWGKANSLGG